MLWLFLVLHNGGGFEQTHIFYFYSFYSKQLAHFLPTAIFICFCFYAQCTVVQPEAINQKNQLFIWTNSIFFLDCQIVTLYNAEF